MSRRIDIELTSARPDGTWTWRAAGAREPKGVLEGAILPDGAKAGDVLKVDADFEVEGITILGLAGLAKARKAPALLELIPTERSFEPVTQTLAKRDRNDRPRRDGERPRRDGDRDRPRRDGDRDRRPAATPTVRRCRRRPSRAASRRRTPPRRRSPRPSRSPPVRAGSRTAPAAAGRSG